MALLSDRQIAVMTATVNRLANATLIEIAVPGAPAANGDPGAPRSVWRGSVPCHLARDQIAVVRDGAETQEDVDVVRVFDGGGAPVDYLRGAAWEATLVTIDDQRGSATVRQRWTVRGVDRDADGTLDSTQLTLDHPEVTS